MSQIGGDEAHPAVDFMVQSLRNATETDGSRAAYSFSDGPPRENPGWQTWIAHDGHEAVQYMLGGSVRLLVSAYAGPPQPQS